MSPQPAPEPPSDRGHGGFAIELSTVGLTSAGFLIGVATTRGAVFGLTIDYRRSKTTDAADTETVTSGTRFGMAVRAPVLATRDRRGDLILAGDIGLETDNTRVTTATFPQPTSADGSGMTFAFGPGLRFWIIEQLAVSYLARLRVTSLDYRGAYAPAGADSLIGIEGAFQVTGVF